MFVGQQAAPHSKLRNRPTSAMPKRSRQNKELTKKLLAAAACGSRRARGRGCRGRLGSRLRNRPAVVVKRRTAIKARGDRQCDEPRTIDRRVCRSHRVSRRRDGRTLIPATTSPAGGGRQVIAAARRDPPQVVGDGKSSVRELVEQVQSRSAPRVACDPR